MQDIQETQILKKVQTEITFDEYGEGYISRRGIARLVGVGSSTVQRHVKSMQAQLKLNENNQLHESSLLPLLRSIGKGSTQVLDIVAQIETIGVRTVFHGVAQPERRSRIAAIREMLDEQERHEIELERLEAMKADKDFVDSIDNKVTRMENVIRNTQCPKGYLPKYKLAEFLGVNMTANFSQVLLQVRSVRYPYSNGKGGVQPKMATAYHIEETRTIIET